MIKFEKVSKYKEDINFPERATVDSAGYDFYCAEEIVIPSWSKLFTRLENKYKPSKRPITLDEIYNLTRITDAKPTLVPTGVKAYMDEDMYLALVSRSSSPLKYWLIMANSVGIIDSGYADNPTNEGEIFFQFINLSPYDIVIKKGEKIGQGIFHHYYKTVDDNAKGQRQGGFGSTDSK